MVRILAVVLIVVFCQASSAQETKFRKNTISIESGIFSRGVVGLSYSRRFLKNDFLFLSSDIFGGIGYSGGAYYGIGFNLNMGREEFFFVLGIDGKHCSYSWGESTFVNEYYFSGIAYNPYIGLSLFTKAQFTVKIRSGFLRNFQDDKNRPSFGISLGYSF